MSKSIETEEARIRTEYAKRQGGGRYSWFEPSYVFLMQERERLFLGALKEYGFEALGTKKILEIGCGSGYWLRELIKWGACPQNITGVDLLSDRVAIAKRLCPQELRISCGSAATLEYPDSSFDIVIQSTVFSSVLDPFTRQQIALEMLRVVKDDGAIFWYDFHANNPRNPNVQGMKKQEIVHLFPGCQFEFRRVTLAPPLARLLTPYSLVFCYLLERLKLFNTHYLCVIRI